jgi:hypothetical protein
MAKVIKVAHEDVFFDNGMVMTSAHDQDCCEHHYLCFAEAEGLLGADIPIDNLEHRFDTFFEKVEGYGIRLLAKDQHPIAVPGYGDNNGYYGTNIDLIVMKDNKVIFCQDVSDCQNISD